MSVKGWKLPSTFDGLIWSPDGDHIALIAKDGSFWRVDYPNMENFEQLTQPMSFTDVRDIIWSPDGTSIAFIKGTDIYIIDTNK
jgi:Tol biopolymer transport system component